MDIKENTEIEKTFFTEEEAKQVQQYKNDVFFRDENGNVKAILHNPTAWHEKLRHEIECLWMCFTDLFTEMGMEDLRDAVGGTFLNIKDAAFPNSSKRAQFKAKMKKVAKLYPEKYEKEDLRIAMHCLNVDRLDGEDVDYTIKEAQDLITESDELIVETAKEETYADYEIV